MGGKMLGVAGGLAAGVIVLFLLLWFQPWETGGGEKQASKGAGKAVKVDQALANKGEQLVGSNGCTGCHSTTGAAGAGPTWQGSYGTEVELTDGKTIKMNGKFIETAILDPAAQVRKGFGPSMPSFKGKLSPADTKAIAEYIKSLSS